MYFDDSAVAAFAAARQQDRNFGISFAFFNSQGLVFSQEELSGIFDGDLTSLPRGYDNSFLLEVFLENLFWGIKSAETALIMRRSAEFLPFLDFLHEVNIVIENSPPSGIDFNNLVKSTSAVSIGTFIGYSTVPEGSVLLFLSIPAGVIVVGTAVGVSKGLENGLNKAIEKLIRRRIR